MRAQVGLLVASLVLAGAGAGCGDGDSGDETPEPGPVLYRTEAIGGDNALMEGTLDLDGLCLVIEVPRGERWLPLFPEATTEWDGAEQVLTFEGQEHGLGDAIAVGGGWRDLSGRLDSFDFATAPDPSCNVEEAWIVPRSE